MSETDLITLATTLVEGITGMFAQIITTPARMKR